MTKILVVDDNVHIRELITLFLRNEGFEIVVAKDGAEALRLWGNPQLIWLSLIL